MPAIPWLLGSLGLGAVGGVVASDRLTNFLRWGAVAGGLYLLYNRGK